MASLRARSITYSLLLSFLFAGAGMSGSALAVCRDIANGDTFFSAARKVHGRSGLSQENVDSYKCIIDYWNQLGLKDNRQLAYAMATAWHESRMRPLREGSGSHKRAVAVARQMYRKRITRRPYHLPHPKTGKVYYGRGLVQLTWATNYLTLGKRIGVGDLLWRNPDLVLQPEMAAKVMLTGMKDGLFCWENKRAYIRKCLKSNKKSVRSRLGLYFNNSCSEWYRARRMINGDIKKTGGRIRGYGLKYLKGLRPIPASIDPGPTPPQDVPVDADATDVRPPDSGQAKGDGDPAPDLPSVKPVKPGEPVTPEEDVASIKPTPDGQKLEADDADKQVPLTPDAKPPADAVSEDKTVKPVLPGDVPDDKPTLSAEELEKLAGKTDQPGEETKTAKADPQEDQTGGGDKPTVTDTTAASAEFQALKAANDSQAQEIAGLKTQLEKQQLSIDSLSGQVQKMGTQLEDANKPVADTGAKDLQRQLAEQGTALAGAKAERAELQKQLAELKQQNTALIGRIDRMQSSTGGAADKQPIPQPDATPAKDGDKGGESGWVDKWIGYVWKK